MNCTICGSSQVRPSVKIGHQCLVFRCSVCKIEFLYPQLDDESLKALYSESYYASWGIKEKEENGPTRQMKIASFQLRLELIKKFRSTGKVLDIGCATGYFLEAA